MIDREKMLDLFVQQAGSMWKHNKSGRVGVFFYYDEYNAVLNLIRTAPAPAKVKRLVDAATEVTDDILNGDRVERDDASVRELRAALAPFTPKPKEPK